MDCSQSRVRRAPTGLETGTAQRTTAAYAPPPEGPVPEFEPLRPGEGIFDRCRLGPQGGGSDVWIKQISCAEARKWVLRLNGVGLGLQDRPRGGVGRAEGGWECWSQLEDRYGPIHNICARGEQLITFYFH